MPDIPDEFAATILRLRGPDARDWLDRLPATLAEYARRWSLTLGEPYAALSFNYVTRATRADGTPVVLKVGLTDDKELRTETEALAAYGGRGMVALLDAGLTDAVLLLERIEPGTPLTAIEDDDRATSIAAEVMRRLWRPTPDGHDFPTVAHWGLGFERHRQRFGGSGPIPADLFERAETLYRELEASMAAPVLLHGDLHHGNILAAMREPWLAIDPKGLIGELAYETGSLLRNPHERLRTLPDAKPLLARRIALLADALNLDRERIRGWGIALAVLSAIWSYEDGDDATGAKFAIGCATALAAIKT
jgi:streptomycin 6-kinase